MDVHKHATNCRIGGCSRPIERGGYCKHHYSQHVLKLGSEKQARNRRRASTAGLEAASEPCAAPGCDRELFKAGYCEQHYVEHQVFILYDTMQYQCVPSRVFTVPTWHCAVLYCTLLYNTLPYHSITLVRPTFNSFYIDRTPSAV